MQDWPLDAIRDVDHEDERIVGLMRGGYIVPFVMRRQPPQKPPTLETDTDDAQAPDATKAAEASTGAAQRKRKRANE